MTEKESAKILNNAAQYTPEEVADAFYALDGRRRNLWLSIISRGATGETGKNFAAIRKAIGVE